MIVVAVLAASICVAASVPPPSSCVVGPWGEWSECQRLNSCEKPLAGQSQPMSDEKKALGKGREAMKKLIDMKNAGYARKEACIKDGSCPQMNLPDSILQRQNCTDGMADMYPCHNVDLLSFVNIADLGYTQGGVSGNDIWVWHDTGVEPVDHYAIMGLTHGTSFVRVTNPEDPEVVGKLDTQVTDPEKPEVLGTLNTHTNPSSWRDMKVVGDFAYIVSEAGGHGMQVFDLTQLRGLSADPTRNFQNTAHYEGVSNTHNIVANEASNTVFLVGATGSGSNNECHDGGLHMVDVSDPLNPTFAGCFDDDGYVHDAQCLFYNGPDTGYTDQEICYCFNEDSLTIVDVTDKTNGVMISRVEYTGVAYSHQGWATEDGRYLYLDDELDELNNNPKNTRTYIWDISDLENPVNTEMHLSTETSSDHNLYITGKYIHQSNYMAGYRIQEIDFEESGNINEVGYFDVYPPDTRAGFEGTWSNYPWLTDPNGDQFIVVSSINYGLFMLKPDWAAIEGSARSPPQGHSMRYREALYGKEGAQCPALADSKSCTPQAC